VPVELTILGLGAPNWGVAHCLEEMGVKSSTNMQRRNAAALALSTAIAFAACDARSAISRQAPRPTLRMSGNANIVSAFHSLPQFSVQTADIGDSEKRLVALQQSSIDVAVAVADVTYMAFNGQLPDHSRPLDKVRGIALLHSAAVHLLVGPTTNPSRGFRGMRVVLGNPVGENTALGERLMNSMGIAKSEIQGEFLPRDIAVEKLLKRDVDALIVTGRLPQKPVVRALLGGARLLDIDGQEIDRLRVYYPLLRRMLIPRGTYPAQEVPVHTIGVDLLLVCRADLDKNLVYELTRAYFEESPENTRRQTDPQRAPAVVIPLHPGAARYYREREVSR
jgi:TRAP transporter TAXI family solute receptor